MKEKTLRFLGLMRKAGAIQIGEINTGAAVRDGKAKLLLLAKDASDNARSRAEGFTRGRNILMVPLPFIKQELSAALGVNGCSMAAVTDIGFANALMEQLLAIEPESYTAQAEETRQRFEKSKRRKKETAAQARNKRTGKRRTNR